MARTGETRRHRELKRAAHAWALSQGYRFSATEVSLPRSAFRADVAACRPAANGQPGGTAVFECKQARPDFLNDSAEVEQSARRLRELNERRATLEARLGVHHPNLALGESLFPEFDRHDFEDLRHEGYRRLRREIRVLERRIFGRSKLDRLLRYGIADACYLVTFEGILDPDEVPRGWGVLVVEETGAGERPDQTSPATADEPGEPEVPAPLRLRLVRRPVRVECPPGARLDLLQRIAAVATRETNRRESIRWEDVFAHARRQATPEAAAAPAPPDPA